MAQKVPNLAQVLDQTSPPAVIWQKPFNYDPGHYKRLCDLKLRPSNSDLIDYINDYQYGDDTQRDLLRFLLPRLLNAWGEDLLDLATDYGGFSEHCLAAFAKRPLCPGYLDAKQFKAVADYVRALIIKRMGQADDRFVGPMRLEPVRHDLRAEPETERPAGGRQANHQQGSRVEGHRQRPCDEKMEKLGAAARAGRSGHAFHFSIGDIDSESSADLRGYST